METTMNAERSRKTRKTMIATLGGGVAGFLGAMGMLTLADSGLLGTLDASREIALLVAMIYLVTGIGLAVGLAAPGFGARFLNVEDADELREQKAMLSASVMGMIALGLALVVAALAAPVGPVPAGVALAGVIGLLIVSWIAGIRQRRHIDELFRSLSRESTALGFYLMFFVGGGWALLAHLGYTAAPQPLDWLTMFAALLLAATFITCARRGMMAMR